MRYTLHHGDNREVLRTMPDNSVDSIVTDPPYELGFMGKKWDSTGIAYDETLWAECLRVLKPGGHLIAFGGTRTYHRMTVAIEDAGFEIRDCIQWIYGSGFPKSLDVSKAIDKQAGAEREVVGTSANGIAGGTGKHAGESEKYGFAKEYNITAPATPEAQQWHGFGTALKPANEPAVLARKPLSGTVADNVLTWGVGALNIDGCRVPSDDGFEKAWDKPVRTNIANGGGAFGTGESSKRGTKAIDISANKPVGGRWPANVILDEEAAQMLDAQSGVSKSTVRPPTGKGILDTTTGWNQNSMIDKTLRGHSDSGGASRFFYIAKASKAEREAGLDGMEIKGIRPLGISNWENQTNGSGHVMGPSAPRANHHPTVKPITLMRYLVRLVTPPNGVVLDPFMGSGSTGCAAMLEAMRFIGIELSAEYLEIARRRIEFHEYTVRAKNPMGL
jgi:site-specific DNA-methyltransferase (adenine-specific)